MGNTCCKDCNCSKKTARNVGNPGDLRSVIEANLKICVWIIGGPGSGKGTQSNMLSERYKLVSLSTGELLRNNVDSSLMGIVLLQTMEQGGLAHTEVVLNLLKEAMEKNVNDYDGFIIDGYPRSVQQGELFCEKIGRPHLIIYLDCPDEVLIERILKRGRQSGRIDDNPESIVRRLETFHTSTEPVVDYWKDSIVRIDGTMSPEEVLQQCVKAFEDMKVRLGIN